MTRQERDPFAADGRIRTGTRDLLLNLADNKRLLGIRYSDCMLGSPSLETGIAAASMAQDEWGHSRLTYALLAEFGDDPKRLEHEREPTAYRSMEALDAPLASYAAMIAAVLLVDCALTVQYQALAESRFTAVRNRVQKLLDEEVLHEHFAAGWTHHLAGSGMRDEFVGHVRHFLRSAARWYGPDADSGAELLKQAGIVSSDPAALRATFLRRIGGVLDHAELAQEVGLVRDGADWTLIEELDWSGWDPVRRRGAPGGPDPDSVARMRGDRNREMLIE